MLGRMKRVLPLNMLVSLVLVMWLAAGSVEALSCGSQPCDPASCPKVDCVGGKVYGPCDCCQVCAKQRGESCGGQYDLAGQCDDGLVCLVSLDFGEAVPEQAVGVCQGRVAFFSFFRIG